jgi:hypothetical protein
MTQRKRVLSIVAGVALLAIAAYFLVSRVTAAFDSREEQRLALDKEKSQKERTLRAGERAVKQLQDFQQQSLPGDPSLAGALYSQWLLKKAVETGLASPNVSPGPARPHGDVFVQHSFLIDCQADLRQVTQFLHQFYSVGYLHRIKSLTLTPIAGKKELKVNMNVEALSLKDAPNPTELSPPPSVRFADKKIEPYMETIVGRNIFSPGNNPPKIASLGTQRGNPNRSVSFTVKATDADPLDKVSYKLEGTAPDGVKLDEKSGEVTWTPTKLGEYEVSVRATDDGLPAKSSLEKIKISVVEAPPVVAETPKKKKLDFDPAHHAFLSAILQTNGKWQIWVTVRTEGKILRFEEGDKISVGSINAVVKAIRPDEAELALDDGGSVVVRIGRTLATEEPAKALPST